MTAIQPRTAVVTIYQGDYLDRIRHLELRWQEAKKAEKESQSRLAADIPESIEIEQERTALIAEAEETAVHVTLKALGRKKWRELIDAHPARPGDKYDEINDQNMDTFPDALVRLAIVEPQLSDDELDDISDIDFDRLYLSAFALNRLVASPKALSLPASLASPGSVEN